MFNTPVLDLVILLSFTYFIGSLILSAINESIAGALRLRQKDLRTGLEKFFFDPQWKGFVKNVILKSPHLQTLMKKKDRVPAYIPAKNFVSALIENLDPTSLVSGKVENKPRDIEKGIVPPIVPPEALKVMRGIMQEVELTVKDSAERMKEFQLRLEEFYNNTMDRVTGWYKIRTRKILLVVGFIMAIVLNIDTIKIANDALKDPDKLSNAVDNIAANLSKLDSLNNTIIVTENEVAVNPDSLIQRTRNNINQLKIVYKESSGYRLGYQSRVDFKKQWGENFWKKLLGVLITAFALQLGANYWFGLMSKVVNIRAAGTKPEEKNKEKEAKPVNR